MKLRVVFIAGAMVTASLFATGTANASLTECPNTSVCMWASNDFVTLLGSRAGGNGILNITGSKNNAMDSWANKNSTYNGAGCDIAGGSGDCQTFAKISNDNNVNPANSDEVSAWRTDHGC